MLRYNGVVQTQSGIIVPGARVTVTHSATGAIVLLYGDAAGNTRLANPITTNSGGEFTFYAEDGTFDIATGTDTLEAVVFSSAAAAGNAISVYKTADTPKVNNSTTLVYDGEIEFAVGQNETWAFIANLRFTIFGTNSGLKWVWDIPAGVVSSYQAVSWWEQQNIPDIDYQNNVALDTESSVNNVNLSSGVLKIDGRIVTGGTAGDVRLQFAQANAQVGDTYFMTNSFLVARKVN